MPVDTLAFVQSFETAGFSGEQARALAGALGRTHEASREDVVTRETLRAELTELKLELRTDMAELNRELRTAMADLRLDVVKEIATVGKDLSNRLWSTVTIIAGVSTAISATIGAGVALLLKMGGL